MEATVVSASKGVIGLLLGKLMEMMEEKNMSLVGVSNDIVFLRDELQTMNDLLEKLDDTGEHGPLAMAWRDKVRELAYDIEDFIDDSLHCVGSGGENAGFVEKISLFVKTLRAHLETAKRIKELNTHLKKINERPKRYKFGDCVSRSRCVAIDRGLLALYGDEAKLVGVEGPREDIIKLLTDTNKQLKVLSIVGFGGLGKTTLAKEVYHKIGGQFDVMAFVSVSQRPDIRRLLHSMQLELEMRVSPSTFNVKVIIDDIREHLRHNRYIVVIDDLWDAPTWDMICSAFPENGMGCIVIVTMQKEDVDCGASYNYRHFSYGMKPLAYHESRILFSRSMFGSENYCPSRFREVSDEILKKCSGIPLAIILVARLLANRPSPLRKEWEGIRDSIDIQESGTNPTFEQTMRQVLHLSYKDLHHSLRTCFLYLGIYPEDSEIERNELVRQWVAEGFVHHSPGQNLEDVAKSYFNELINRSLIQPANTNYGEVVSCRVHDTILDFILTSCNESNFISVAYNLEEMRGQNEYKIRRVSLDPRIGGAGAGDTAISGITATCLSLSHIRSVQLIGEPLPVLFLSKYLRVLTLECERVDLTAIGRLFQLRYLNVSAGVMELPPEIQGLQYLSTFQIVCTNEIRLPPDIVCLPRLRHLILPSWWARLPNGIGRMKSLCTLDGFDISDLKNISEFGLLTNLRVLKLSSRQVPTDTKIDALVTSLGKLCNLLSLSICSVGQWTHDVNDRLGSLSHPPFFHIEKLELIRWLLPRVPRWINSDLQDLIHLNLSVKEISTDDVGILGEVPSLNDLYLWVQNFPQDGASIVFGSVGFPALENLKIHCGGDLLSRLRFEAGAMPNLKKLTVSYMDTEWSGTAPVGIENLTNLRDLQLFPSSDSGTVDIDRIRRVFAEVIEAHGRNLAGAALQVCYRPFPRTVAEDP